MVAAYHLVQYGGTFQIELQSVGNQEVVDAPPHVLLAGMEPVAPP